MSTNIPILRVILLAGTILYPVNGALAAAPAPEPAVSTDAEPAASATTATVDGQPVPDNRIAEGSEIVVTGTRANKIAPVTASLEATEPQAIVSRSFIEDSLPATADFNQLALITPSFSNTGGDGGLGISESKGQLRGFQDGEYNITYDGVPFGDTNDPTHHSNTFFPSDTIETVVVERGPGNASNLGQATFGGSVNLFSRATRPVQGVSARASYGTNNTVLGRLLLQSGAVRSLGGTEILVGGQYVRTDGVRSFAPYHQTNLFGKVMIPFGDAARLTLLSTYNKNHFNQPDNDGPTLAQVAAFGKHFLLNDDPATPQYRGYNFTDKTTDFELAKLEIDAAPGVRFENRAYTYHYNNSTVSASDTTDTPGVSFGVRDINGKVTPALADHIPGYTKLNSYRTYGDIAKGMFDFGPATLTAGAWYEWNDTPRARFEYDMTAGGPDANAYNYNQKYKDSSGVTHYTYVNYDQHSDGHQFQPFAELEIRPIPNLKITPGIKYVTFTRNIDAIANQKTHLPANFHANWTSTLPFLTVNYQPRPDLALYGQYARGFLAPPLSVLYNLNPTNNTVKPQTSDNYQAGFVYHGSNLSIDGDAYYIDFDNKFASIKVNGDTVFFNQGGVVYKGLEGEVTYAFDNGLALFVNGSLNSARSKETHLQVAKAPKATAAAGVLYKRGPIKVSLIDKYIAVQYADDQESPGYRIPGYNVAIVSVGYDFGRFGIEGTVSDLFNSEKVTSIDINDGPINDQYHFQPGREASISLIARF
ncbi:MAG: TonB-dependent receptor [Sphingomicrobium sp.]